ncbi:MAG: nitrous oxide-stimulated promoter family protein [Phycisphaerales bacterium]|nr:nitrous oxide-stimulated promoter family protein [Phycisphaerae bacterium]NNF43909.1 nitrous oxide-stimulated promoter family protein [Phycisphaerales bacterium]NNM27252.1 nitrous oxide-stimulated promoter family protein [Phycisphaerales bacterium]
MESRRIRREKKTVSIMIEMYCRDQHDDPATPGLCDGCRELHEHAMLRIDKCPFCLAKPTCVNCPVHCYKKDMRARIREVMAYAGPRMMRRHPILAMMHVVDGFRKVEAPSRARGGVRRGS